jgi:hypothetical protein
MGFYNVQRWCAWSGIAAVTLFFAAFLVAGFLPIPGPSLTQAQVVAMYTQNSSRILMGAAIMMTSGMFVAPLVGVISHQMDRMQGVPAALSYAQITAGAVGILFFIIPALLFMITAYRPDRPPELTMLMNDASWIVTVLPWPPAFMDNLVIGIAILMDRGEVFPRWVAWMNFVVCGSFLPATALLFVKSGPFAWNGLVGFMIPGTTFTVWFIVMTWALLRAVGEEQQGKAAYKGRVAPAGSPVLE